MKVEKAYDLVTQISILQSQLSASIKMLRQNGTEYAIAERDYKIKLRQEALKLKETLPVTMINLTCYGIPEVAELRMKRDIADATYRANQEAINSIKLQIRILDNQISREWHTSMDD